MEGLRIERPKGRRLKESECVCLIYRNNEKTLREIKLSLEKQKTQKERYFTTTIINLVIQ